MDWTSGLFALGGTILGGLVTLIGTLVSLRDGARRAREERLSALRAEQRRHCQEYLGNVDALQSDGEQLLGALEAGGRKGESRTSEAYEDYITSWRAFTTSSAAVRVTCPDAVVDAANILRELATRWAMLVDASHDGGQPRGLESRRKELNEMKHTFASAVRKSLAH